MEHRRRRQITGVFLTFKARKRGEQKGLDKSLFANGPLFLCVENRSPTTSMSTRIVLLRRQNFLLARPIYFLLRKIITKKPI